MARLQRHSDDDSNRMTNAHDNYIDDLLRPEDDRSWKLAVGHILREQLSEARKTNGRITEVEKWRDRMELQESIKKAVDEASANTLISKAQWKKLTLFLGGFGAVIAALSQFIEPVFDRMFG